MDGHGGGLAALPAAAPRANDGEGHYGPDATLIKAGSDEWSNFVALDPSGGSRESLRGWAASPTDVTAEWDGPGGEEAAECHLAPGASRTEEAERTGRERDADDGIGGGKADEKRAAREVRRLLGLPRGHRGAAGPLVAGRVIMSSATEQRLRELVQRGAGDEQEGNCGVEKTSSFRLLEQGGKHENDNANDSAGEVAFTADAFPPTNDNGGGPPLVPQLGDNANDIGRHAHLDPREPRQPQRQEENILAEGERYLALSLLVYLYALLREASVLGHTAVTFDEVDVRSYQSTRHGNGGDVPSSYLDKTKSAGYVVRVVVDELAKDGGSLGAGAGIHAGDDGSAMREFQRLVADSRAPRADAAAEATLRRLRTKVARRRWRRAISAVRLLVRLGKSTSGASLVQDGTRTRNTTAMQQQQSTGRGGPRKAFVGGIESSTSLASTSSAAATDLARAALNAPRYFRDGSLMANLVESGIEVAWFGDRHPHDVVYSVCIHRRQKRVAVVFRGTVTSHNWSMNGKCAMAEHANPVSDEYPGREDAVGLHTGFALYLLKPRKDNGRTKLDEIFARVDAIGRELAPGGDYELGVTGHSLGGALATIFSFYAAASDVFADVKSIRAFTYAAPRVGCQSFLRAFQHLERKGRLRLARFSNTHDLVPLVPFCSIRGSAVRRYHHVGVHVRLHSVKCAPLLLRRALDVTYPKHTGVWSQMRRGLSSSLVRHLNTLKGYVRCHTLSEYQSRLHFAREYRSALSLTDFFRCKKRSRLKSLDQYYFIKGASSETGTSTMTGIFLEDQEKRSDRRNARRTIVFLLLLVLVEATALFCFFGKEVHHNTTTIDRSYLLSSFYNSLFALLIQHKDMHTHDRKPNLALPYVPARGCQSKQSSLWGIRLPHSEIPSRIRAQLLSDSVGDL